MVIVINKWAYIRVGLYSGGGGAYIWNEVSVIVHVVGLYTGGLIFGGGLYSEVYCITIALQCDAIGLSS